MTALFIFVLIFIVNGLIINRIKESNLQYFLLFLEFSIPIWFAIGLKDYLTDKDYPNSVVIAFAVALTIFIPIKIIFKRIRKNKERYL